MPDQIEQARIRAYARGWNDAMLGRAPRDTGLSYALGYMDAKR